MSPIPASKSPSAHLHALEEGTQGRCLLLLQLIAGLGEEQC